MEDQEGGSWEGRVAVVTGGNSGIGLGIVRRLLQLQMDVVAMDLEVDALQELSLRDPRVHPVLCDLRVEEDVRNTFQYLEDNLGGVDVLVNNAGVAGHKGLLDGSPNEWRRLLDVNVVALCLCSREAAMSMRRRQITDGHIIHISSNVAHFVPQLAALHFYTATKHAVRALADGMRYELQASGIRVATISPGLVKTEIFRTAMGTAAERQVYQQPSMEPEDVADAVVQILNAPAHLQVHDVILKPVQSIA